MFGRLMKHFVYISFAAVCFVAAISCSKRFQGAEPESFSGEEQLVELTASLQPHVRTYLNSEFKTRWNDGDVVAVFDGQKRQFDMTANSGASATFSGHISTEATTVYAVYPFSGAESEDGGDNVTVNIPAEQIIADGESTARGALVAVSKVTSLGSGVSFKNVVGLVKVTLGEGIASVKLTGANNEGIAGSVQVNAADGSLVGSPSGTSVVIKPVSGTFAAGDYYIAVAPVTLADGFTLTFHNQYSASAKKVGANSLAIPQNGGKDLGDVTTGLVFPSGLPCGWNFYAAGYTSASESLTSLRESENGQHWLNDGYLLPTSGINADARLTAVTTKDAGSIERSFNPSIQFNGMAKNDYWDPFFRNTAIFKLISKINLFNPLKDLPVEVLGAATVADAYEIKKIVQDSNSQNGFKLINSGTVDPYLPYWGIRPCRYIKGSYIYPKVPAKDLKNYSEVRFNQASSPKIIVASMTTRYEACLDICGEFIAGKSTTIILGDTKQLYKLTAIINSKLASYWLNIVFNSLKMSGGAINIGRNELQILPIPNKDVDFMPLVNKIMESKASSSLNDTTALEHEIDMLVYDMYGLTEDEIKIVEGTK